MKLIVGNPFFKSDTLLGTVWIFEGHDQKGTRYGKYINKKGQGKDAIIDY